MPNADSFAVLTHEAFARAPIVNSRRPGRYPKSVVNLEYARRTRHNEEAGLRAWAREHANAYWTLDQIRREKQRRDAIELLDSRGDKVWQEVAELIDYAFELRDEAFRLREALINRQLAEQNVHGGRHE